MNRADEIKALQSLKGDTYFAQLFSASQIDAMCENIKHDFPIETGIDIFENSEASKERARLTAKIQHIKDTDCEAACAILEKASEHADESMDAIAHMLIGFKNCLRIKIHRKLNLNNADREELQRIIDQSN